MMKKRIFIFSIVTAALICGSLITLFANLTLAGHIKEVKTEGNYKVVYFNPLPDHKLGQGKNKVQGVVLHHTACSSARVALGCLHYSNNANSCHLLIDRDGTRYVLASPDQITHHAGYSVLNGKSGCNKFTIGIEFQSIDTHVQPLTDAQIESAIDYLIPIMKKYKIPMKNIVTHEQVNSAWHKRHPGSNVSTKIDIAPSDHQRFMTALKKRYK